MLMEEPDTEIVDGERDLRSPSEAVADVRARLRAKKGMDEIFSRTLRRIVKAGAFECVTGVNDEPD
jgi:hypothetical protein